MTEIELGRLLEGDHFIFPTVLQVVANWDCGVKRVRAIRSELRLDSSTVVLIDDATMERVREREAKNEHT